MTTEKEEPKRRVSPMECATVHYVCEQIEDSIERNRRALNWYKESLAEGKIELEERSKADYLGSVKDEMIASSEESINRYEQWIAEAEADTNRLLELLQEARSLEKRILAFWEEKEKRR